MHSFFKEKFIFIFIIYSSVREREGTILLALILQTSFVLYDMIDSLPHNLSFDCIIYSLLHYLSFTTSFILFLPHDLSFTTASTQLDDLGGHVFGAPEEVLGLV